MITLILRNSIQNHSNPGNSLLFTCFSLFLTLQDDLNFKETEMHKSQSTAASLGSGKDWNTNYNLLEVGCYGSAINGTGFSQILLTQAP